MKVYIIVSGLVGAGGEGTQQREGVRKKGGVFEDLQMQGISLT